jgi:hypothetical protein
MEALQHSTTMLKVSRRLLEQGNRAEAKRLQDEARAKRDASVLLMTRANELERLLRRERAFHRHEFSEARPH